VSVTKDQAPLEDEPSLPDVGQILDKVNCKSIKEALLACLVIRAARRPITQRRGRVVATYALLASVTATAGQYLHVWAGLVRLFH
jgi:hypothetical protein